MPNSMIKKDSNRLFPPIIRWAGSKRKLLKQLQTLLPTKIDRYIEPFCGSASLFFQLNPEKAVLSDINEDLITALKLIKNDVLKVEQLRMLPNTKECYYNIRESVPESDIDRALRFLYLNRYCFNGVYRTNKSGHFNVPIGTKTGTFPSEEVFINASKKLQKADIICCEYYEQLINVSSSDFIYIDPPYTASGKFTGEYGIKSFNAEDLPKLIKLLADIDNRGARFLFSYRDTTDVMELLPNHFRINRISVDRHIKGFKDSWQSAKEIIVRNYG